MLETSRIVIIPDSTEPVSAATVTAGTDENAFFGCNPSYGSLNTIPPGLELAILLASEKNVQSVFDFCLRKCAISHHKQYFQEQLRYLNG